MDNEVSYIDGLTRIYNENYLKRDYQKYIDKYPESKFIMIDFKKFKHYNDTFGHDVGDKYLIAFAKILFSVFDDSIVVRLHGDEYAVLTKYDKEDIEKRIYLCNQKIDLMVKSSTLPEMFEFNAGIVNAEHGIDSTRAKADYMMYHAKNNNENYQFFDDKIWQVKMEEEAFLDNISTDINTDNLSYYQRDIHNDQNIKIKEISTRDSQGNSIFSEKNYKLLRDNSQLRKVDMYNLEYLFSKITSILDGKVLINIDYKSILAKRDLLAYLKLMIEIYKIDSSNIILSINTNDITSNMYKPIITTIEELRKLGFKICLDKYNSLTPDIIWENVDLDYIKIDSQYWKKSMSNPKIAKLISNKVQFLSENGGTNSIFTCIENEQEYNHVKKLTNNRQDVLLSGNYLSNEERIKIK